MSYTVEWHEAAYKQLKKLDGTVRARILQAVDGLKEDPRLIVTVVKVDHRSRVYKDRS